MQKQKEKKNKNCYVYVKEILKFDNKLYIVLTQTYTFRCIQEQNEENNKLQSHLYKTFLDENSYHISLCIGSTINENK